MNRRTFLAGLPIQFLQRLLARCAAAGDGTAAARAAEAADARRAARAEAAACGYRGLEQMVEEEL